VRILVTGGAGFIGSNFVRHLLAKYPDYEVVVLDKLAYAGNVENLESVSRLKQLSFIQADICDSVAVAQALVGCNAVVNFAAETHVDRSISQPAFLAPTYKERLCYWLTFKLK
jgi:dTDP-glucose 4,6-dehydratase